LGRATGDYDVALQGDVPATARGVARATNSHVFKLSEGFDVWRVLARDRSWQIDLLPLAGETIEDDLARRDFSINAMAQPLGNSGLVDPFGGMDDLRARRLRMVSERIFDEDPLRTLRLARVACELGFEVDPRTQEQARRSAPSLNRVAGERVFAELKRIVIADAALDGLDLLDALHATQAVLPELPQLAGIEQSPYHHLDVLEHTRSVLAETIALERSPGKWLGEHRDAVAQLLAEPLADELTRGQALRFGALLHDIAKPQTRRVTAEGRITFIGHDQLGAEVTLEIMRRLRASDRLAEHVAALARHHLRLGFLVHEAPLGRRAIYRYLRACEPVQVDVTLLSAADRIATRGRGSEQAIARHLELARQLLGEALRWRRQRPRPPIGGDELRSELGLVPGPEIGRVLSALEEEAFAGEIETPQQAIERARQLAGFDR
jgi:putative nucleotidyltransferase with HDIG domain